MTPNDAHDPFDPISLEIMWSRLITITEEAWLTIRRTAFSLIIGEVRDFGCELLDAKGESLAHSPRSMPVFNLALPRAVKALLEAFPPETLVEGDTLITNDPWLCAGHLSDVALGNAGLQRRDARGSGRLGRPLLRHRRHPRLARRPRDLRRGTADTTDEVLPGGRNPTTICWR